MNISCALLRVSGLAALLFAVVAGAAASFAGRRVNEVLDQLHAGGLSFIYNTLIVPDSLLVVAEPDARGGIALAAEILAPHGLKIQQVGARTFVVVAKPSSATSNPETEAPRAPAGSLVEQVVVQTSRYAFAATEVDARTFLNQEQINNLPRLADEPLRAVQRLPGTAVNGFSSLGPIRGGAPDETAILLDGLRLYEPFHLKNFLNPVSLLDARLVDTMDVYSGGFPVIYGDRMSAIVDARTVRPAAHRYYEMGLSVFHLNALASGAFADDRGHALVSARRSNLGELAKLSETDFGRPDYADGFARLDYAFTAATRGSFSALLAHDSVTAITDGRTQRARDEYDNGYVWATVEHDWSPQANTRLIASYTQVDNHRVGSVNDVGKRTGRIDDARAFDVFGLRIDNELATAWLAHRFGAEVRRLSATYDYSNDVHFSAGYPFPASTAVDKSSAIALRPDGYESSAYWDGRVELRRWTAQAGLRVDTQTYDGSGDAGQWSPRLSLLHDASASTRLRLSWGRFFQSQGINELQVEDGVDRFYPAQHADHAIISVEHAFGETFDLRLEAYRKDYRRVNPRFENLLDPLALLPELQFDRVRIAPQSARADGLEALLNWRPKSAWSGWLSYTWSQVHDRIDGQEVDRSWDQRHAVSVGIAWTRGPWAATLADTYHSGWPTTRLELVPAAEPGAPPTVVLGKRNADRYASYNSLDFRITRTFELPRGQLDAFIEASNLTSRGNPCCTEYELVRNEAGNYELRREFDEWLPLVPSFGVLWRY